VPLIAHELLNTVVCALTGAAIFAWGIVVLRTQLRWFAAGAVIWFLGAIVLKGLAASLTFRGLHALEPHVSAAAYLALTALHSGLLTGIFEPGTTWVAGWRFRSLAAEPARMLAVGVGAASGEAVFLAAIGVLQVLGKTLGPHAGPNALEHQLGGSSLNVLHALIPLIERLLAGALHIGARVLVLSSLAHKRPAYFAYAFALMGTVDAWAAFAKAIHLGIWTTELGFVPQAAISLAVMRWALRPRPSTTS